LIVLRKISEVSDGTQEIYGRVQARGSEAGKARRGIAGVHIMASQNFAEIPSVIAESGVTRKKRKTPEFAESFME
jgi:hypothetical protein